MQHKNNEEQWSLKQYFIPLTTFKAIHFITIIGFIVFGNMLLNDFVWDDIQYVIPSSISNGLNLIDLFSPNIFNSYGYYRPIPALYFSLIYNLFSSTTFYYHLFQLLFHIANSVLLFVLFKKLLNKSTAFLLSLVFLIHPIQVESVSYIAQTASVLFFFFGIVAVLLSTRSNPSKKNIFATYALLLLSLLTKEVAIAFIPVILLYRYLYGKGYLAQYMLVSFLAVASYLIIRFVIGNTFFYQMVFVPIAQLSFFERLLNIPQIIVYYFKTVVFPINLAVMQNWTVTELTFPSFYLPLAILISLTFLAVVYGKKLYKSKQQFHAYIFFSVWLLIGIGFYLQIMPLDQTVADRWFYFPLAGLLGMLGVISQTVKYRKVHFVVTILLIIIVLLSIRTIVRNSDWSSPLNLYTHDSQFTDSYNLESHLGSEYAYRNEWDKAIIHYKKSILLQPNDLIVTKLGYMYERKGDQKQAKKYYFESLDTVTYASTHKHALAVYQNLGRYLLYFDHNPTLAKEYILQGLSEYKDDLTLWILLVQAESKLSNQREALKAAKFAYSLNPNEQVKQLYILISNNKPIDIPVWTFYASN